MLLKHANSGCSWLRAGAADGKGDIDIQTAEQNIDCHVLFESHEGKRSCMHFQMRLADNHLQQATGMCRVDSAIDRVMQDEAVL